MPSLKNITTMSGLFCERTGGVKLKLYSGSVAGRTFQPRVRNQKNTSPIEESAVAEGRFEMAFCAAVSVAVVNVDGLIAVVCDRPEGRSVPYLVEGQSLSYMM